MNVKTQRAIAQSIAETITVGAARDGITLPEGWALERGNNAVMGILNLLEEAHEETEAEVGQRSPPPEQRRVTFQEHAQERFVQGVERLGRLTRLNAPALILQSEVLMLQRRVRLLDAESWGRVVAQDGLPQARNAAGYCTDCDEPLLLDVTAWMKYPVEVRLHLGNECPSCAQQTATQLAADEADEAEDTSDN